MISGLICQFAFAMLPVTLSDFLKLACYRENQGKTRLASGTPRMLVLFEFRIADSFFTLRIPVRDQHYVHISPVYHRLSDIPPTAIDSSSGCGEKTRTFCPVVAAASLPNFVTWIVPIPEELLISRKTG